LKQNKILIFIVSMLIPIFAGLIGSFATSSQIPSWYESLNKPSFTPPTYIFSIVWTILYLMMGVALYLVLLKGWSKIKVRNAVYIFLLQLLLNVSWSIVFFGFHQILLALIALVTLLFILTFTICQFSNLSKIAAWLLVPYLLWAIFAFFLNFAFSVVNF